MSLTVERKLPVILFFVVFVLTASGFALYRYTTSLQDAADLERQTQNTVSRLDEVTQLTSDAGSALSSFIITGNDSYLGSYERAKVKIPQSIAELRTRMADTPRELDELSSLENYTADYLAQYDSKIERRKTEGFEATIPSLGDSSERLVSANIRASVDTLKSAELKSLEGREDALDQSFYRTIGVLIFGCLAGVIALGLANLVVFREMKKRRGAEMALTVINQELEEKIQDRTKELENVNESLTLAAVEREELLESERYARQDAEAANRLRDDFMATVSHELKNPLNAVLGWARILQRGELSEGESTKALGIIIKNSEAQNRLNEDLLDVARIISGKLALAIEPVELTDLVQDAMERAAPLAGAKQIEIAQEIDGSATALTVDGDRDRLTQVFSNLLTNAVKFTPEGGRIVIRIDAEDTRLRVHVKDNGIGIKEEFLPLVFERFRQDLSASSRNVGLGLGLAIVRHLVEMHGGKVSVQSGGPDQGSEFTVELPARQRADLPKGRPA